MIELTCPSVGHDRWDQHSNLRKGHEDKRLGRRPADRRAADDLAARGLLDDTLVCGPASLAAHPSPKAPTGAITIPLHFPFGWRAVVCAVESPTVRPMSSVTKWSTRKPK